MTTLSIRISEEQKRMLRTQAAFEGKTMTEYVLNRAIPKQRGTVWEGIKDLEEGRYEEFESFEDLCDAIRSW